MRKWLAVVAFLPAVAWGSETEQVSQCINADEAYRAIAAELMKHYRNGVSQELVTEAADSLNSDEVSRQVWRAGIEYVWRNGDLSIPEELRLKMKQECIDQVTR